MYLFFAGGGGEYVWPLFLCEVKQKVEFSVDHSEQYE